MWTVLRGGRVARVRVRAEALRPLAHLAKLPPFGQKSGAGASKPDVRVHRQVLRRLDRARHVHRHRHRRQVLRKDFGHICKKKYKGYSTLSQKEQLLVLVKLLLTHVGAFTSICVLAKNLPFQWLVTRKA